MQSLPTFDRDKASSLSDVVFQSVNGRGDTVR